jgi:heat shock protein HslJ
MKTLITLSVLIISVLFSGCSSGDGVDNSKALLENTWVLKSMGGSPVNILPGKDITLEFDKSLRRVSGFGGCNTYFGNYTHNKSGLTFSEIVSTEMACDDLKTESDYFRFLQKTDKYKIVSNTLSFYGSGSEILTFEKK